MVEVRPQDAGEFVITFKGSKYEGRREWMLSDFWTKERGILRTSEFNGLLLVGVDEDSLMVYCARDILMYRSSKGKNQLIPGALLFKPRLGDGQIEAREVELNDLLETIEGIIEQRVAA